MCVTVFILNPHYGVGLPHMPHSHEGRLPLGYHPLRTWRLQKIFSIFVDPWYTSIHTTHNTDPRVQI